LAAGLVERGRFARDKVNGRRRRSSTVPYMGENLKDKVLKGGALMLVRQIFSLALNLVSAFWVVRLIGPGAYGAYTAAIGIYTYAQNFGQSGIGVYLMRSATEPSQRDYHVASTLLLATSTALLLVLVLAAHWIGNWVRIPGFVPLLTVLALALPVQSLTQSAAATFERDMDFRRVVMIELGGQVASLVVVIPLALSGFGAWALVIGFLVQQGTTCGAFLVVGRYWPRLVWDREAVGKIFRYASGYTAADWIWQLRTLVNPLIVGHFLGAEAVGIVGLANRLVGILSFFPGIAWRISIVALAKIQSDDRKIREATTTAMQLQILGLGPFLLAFALVGEPLFPVLFGSRWDAVMPLFPYLAFPALTSAMFQPHSSALYVRQRNIDMVATHALHVILYVGVTWFAVQRVGLVGVGLGEIAALAACGLLHVLFVREFGAPDYRVAALWWFGISFGLYWQKMGPWALAVPVIAFLSPSSLRALRGFVVSVREHRLG
jgi:O-antigen/teichoic acid export membrane protein